MGQKTEGEKRELRNERKDNIDERSEMTEQ